MPLQRRWDCILIGVHVLTGQRRQAADIPRKELSLDKIHVVTQTSYKDGGGTAVFVILRRNVRMNASE